MLKSVNCWIVGVLALAGGSAALNAAIMLGWAIRLTYGDTPLRANGLPWEGPEPLTAILIAVACIGLTYVCIKIARHFFNQWIETGK